MSDSSALIDNAVSVSSDLMYNLKASACRSRSYRCSLPPTTKSQYTMQSNELCTFQIPCGRRGTYLMSDQSYIKATIINNDTSGTCFLDTHGSCWINRIDILHSSNTITTIQDYNVLMNYLTDFQIGIYDKIGLSANYGFANSNYNNPRQGASIGPNGQGYTVAIPLIGSIFLGCDKYIPLGKLTSDLIVNITVESLQYAFAWDNLFVVGTTPTFFPNQALSSSNGSSINLSNVEMELMILELSDEGESIVNSYINYPEKPIVLHCNDWRHYNSQINALTTGGFSCLIGARYASLKGLHVLPRKSTDITSVESYSIGSRQNFNCQSYFFRIGSYIIPQKQIYLSNSTTQRGYSEAFMELVKTFHSTAYPSLIAGIPSNYYNVSDVNDSINVGNGQVNEGYTQGNSCENAFAIAINLDSFALKDDVLLSGINCLSSNVFFEGNIGNVGPAVNYTLDIYANYDCLLIIDNGVMSARF